MNMYICIYLFVQALSCPAGRAAGALVDKVAHSEQEEDWTSVASL